MSEGGTIRRVAIFAQDKVILSLAMSGHFLYAVSQGGPGISIYDLSNPRLVKLAKTLSLEECGASYLAVFDHRLYASGCWVRVYDLADPANPTLLGKFGAALVGPVFVQGGYGYVSLWDWGFEVYDIRDLQSPSKVAALKPMGGAVSIFVDGHRAYVSTRQGGGIRVYDVEDPSRPFEIGAIAAPGGGALTFGSDGKAYIADGQRGLEIYDVSRPAYPALLGRLAPNVSITQAILQPPYAFLIDGGGLRVADIHDPEKPTAVYETRPKEPDFGVSQFRVDVQIPRGGIVDSTDKEIQCPPTCSLIRKIKQPNEGATVSARAAPGWEFRKWFRCAVSDRPTGPCWAGAGRRQLPLAGFGRPGSSRPLARYGIAVAGDYAFVAAGDLQVYRLNGRSTPVRVSTWATPGEANAVAVAGDYAYVADGDQGLQIVDIRDMSHLKEAGNVALPNWAEDVVLDGHYAYVAAGGAGIRVVDISKPEAPKEVSFSHGGRFIQQLARIGNFLYAADDTAGLGVHDISNPESPNEVTRIPLGEAITSVAAWGDRVYAAEEKGGRVHILDAADPANPREIGVLTTGGWGAEVAALAAEDNLLFAGDLENGIRIFDVTDAASPVEVGYRLGTYSPLALAVDGETGLVFDGGGEMLSFDTALETGLEYAGTYETWAQIGDLKAVGDRLYVANRQEGLRILDMKDPANPRQIARYLWLDAADRVAVSGSRAYVALNNKGISILSLDDPAQPIEIGGYEIYTGFRELAVMNSQVYAARSGGFVILDAANPKGLFEAGYYNGRSLTVDVDVIGNYVLFGEGSFGLTVLDAGNPVDPEGVWHGDDLGGVSDIRRAGNLALVSCDWGFVVLDVKDPARPMILARSPLGIGMPTLSGQMMFGIVDSPWLATFDMSNPTRPLEIGRHRLPDSAVAIQASNSQVYVADKGGRIITFRIVRAPSESAGK